LQGGDHPIEDQHRAANDPDPNRFSLSKPLPNQIPAADFGQPSQHEQEERPQDGGEGDCHLSFSFDLIFQVGINIGALTNALSMSVPLSITKYPAPFSPLGGDLKVALRKRQCFL